MPAPGPRLLALLLVTAALGAGCTGDPADPAPSPDAEDQPCGWAARFVDRGAYHQLPSHGPGPYGYLPFENRSLEAVYGEFLLERVFHANRSAGVPNPTTGLDPWLGPAPGLGPVPAGLRIESEGQRVHGEGDEAFVVHVGEDVAATRAALVAFLGQVTGENRSTRLAWAERALENVTPVASGEDPRRIEVPFAYPDSDIAYPPGAGPPSANLTLTALYEDLAAETPPTLRRAPGVLVAEFDDWWWVFQLKYVAAAPGHDPPAPPPGLLVDRNGRGWFHVTNPAGNKTAADARAEMVEAYDTLGLGLPPNVTFEPVTWGPPCPEPTIPPSHG